MKFKGTAVLFVILALLAGGVYWFDLRDGSAGPASGGERRLLPFDAEDFRLIRLTYPDRRIEAERTGEGWALLSPPGLEPDSAAWDALAGDVSRIDHEEMVATAGSDLASYGLENPALRLTVRMSDGRTEEILFGGENPRRTHRYTLLVSTNDVFLTERSWLDRFDKDIDDLRDRTVLRFEDAGIDRVEISGESRLVLRKADDTWVIEDPVRAVADSSRVSTFLGAIGFARAVGFVDEASGELPDGFDPPLFRILLHEGASNASHELIVGGPVEAEAGRYFARDSSRSAVFVIDDQIVRQVRQPVLEWRDRRIADFQTPDIQGVTLDRAGSRLELRRSGADWVLGDGRRVRAEEVSRMLNRLEFGRATEIIDSPGALAGYGLSTPRLELVLTDNSGTSRGFHFGSDTEDGEHVYWKAENVPEIKVISKDILQGFEVSAEDLLVEPGLPEPAETR